MAPLIVVTFIFWRACKPMFWRPMSVLSLRTAVDMDHNDRCSRPATAYLTAYLLLLSSRARPTFCSRGSCDCSSAQYQSRETKQAEGEAGKVLGAHGARTCAMPGWRQERSLWRPRPRLGESPRT